jgi:hypothetical protein
MNHHTLVLPLLLMFIACAERPRLPTEIDEVSNEPSVANEVNNFTFEIGAVSFDYSVSYPLDFNSRVVHLYVKVSNYSLGTGTLVLHGGGNSLIFSHSLSDNQDHMFSLSGMNIPENIQLAFNNYRGRVRIRIEPN